MNTAFFIGLVEEFHRTFRYKWPSPVEPDFSERTLRTRTMLEEINELIASGNRVDELDALCDLQYFLSGTVLCMGFRGMFDASLPATIKHPASGLSHVQAMTLWVNCFDASAERLNVAASILALCKLQLALFCCVEQRGFSEVFEAAFATVHNSNMSKLFSEEELFELANEELANPESELTHEAIGDEKYIVRRGDGKIMKPRSFVVPDLSQFV